MSCDDIYCTGSCAECVERERQSMLDDLDAANKELAALRQRCEDLEMMLRAELSDCYRLDRYHGLDTDGRGNWWLELWHVRKHDGPSRKWTLLDDGTGLPVLTPEAREALRKP